MADEEADTLLGKFLSWFPSGKDDPKGWRFDVITLLAIIGEGSVAEHAQTISASSLCLLPRIIPAPQALLKPIRPQRLPEVTAKMAGVYGGVVLDTVGFFANIIHPLEDLKPFAFKVLEIKHKHLIDAPETPMSPGWKNLPFGRGGGWRNFTKKSPTKKRHPQGGIPTSPAGTGIGSALPPLPSPIRPSTTPLQTTNLRPRKTTTFSAQVDLLEQGRALHRSTTLAEKFTDMVTNPTMANSQDRYTVPPTLYSPLHLISLLSFLLTIALLICSIRWKDGTAIVAISLVSLASSVIGAASWWRPLLMNRRTTNKVPRGDVVIRTREGAFVLIKCTEEVARELYSGTEECQYVVGTKFYRVLMGLGMVLLMISVVLLGNCGWESQAFIGASYILLNGVYWALGLLPHKMFWDLGRYVCVDITPHDAKKADEPTGEDPREGTPSFTRTLWFAIRETKHGAWVERSGALPGTEQWRRWLRESVQAARRGERGWKAVGRKNEIMKEEIEAWREQRIGDGEEGEEEEEQVGFDLAEQEAPLVQVQGPIRAPTFS
ncbi:hypothetical protein QBC37DRAFT_271768 [Rhypophila decipiens]|uniref:Uncharacterized protein n=1 Tax=Rhypophila decipiens TaxID=261697 RepID=A0AAN6YNB0_9PEZI|nr:hypothetical protein QBC37DRAFT_271768 [Rhypophila decipiens]